MADFSEMFPPIALEMSEISDVSSNVQSKIRSLQQQSSLANQALKQVHAFYNSKLKQASENQKSVVGELEKTNSQHQDLKKQYEAIEHDRNERIRLLHESESARDRAVLDQNELRRRIEAIESEKEGLSMMLNRRQEAATAFQEEIAKLREDVSRQVAEKAVIETKLFDVESKERRLDERQEKLANDEQLSRTRMNWLERELERKDTVIMQLKSSHSDKVIDYETRVNNLTQDLRLKSTSLEQYKEQQVKAHEQVERLSARVKTLEVDLCSQREEYEKEINAQKDLIRVLEDNSSASESKIAQLVAAVEEGRSLQDESKQALLMLQEELDDVKKRHDEEMSAHKETIEKLEDELKHANELLSSKNRVMLSDEEVAKLSPGAAAASKMIREGITLTGMYREHIKVVEELNNQKLQNKKLEQYFNELVQDIRNKAPVLRQQRDDYERAIVCCDRLRKQLADVDVEQQELRAGRDNLDRELTYTKSELERYQRDAKDLNDQVRHLVRVIEMQRQGLSDNEMESDGRSASPGNAVLFKNIDELQETNQRLMSELREAQVKRDELVKAAQQAEMAKLNAQIADLQRELASESRVLRERELLLTSAIDQRDRYKHMADHWMKRAKGEASELEDSGSMAPGSTDVTDSTSPPKTATKDGSTDNAVVEAIKQQLAQRESDLAQLKQKMEEKDREHTAELKEQNKEMNTLRSVQGKQDAELKYQQERFKFLTRISETYKTEIDGYKQRIAEYETKASTDEVKMKELLNELLSGRSELVGLRVDCEQLKEKLASAEAQVRGQKSEMQVMKDSDRRHEQLIRELQSLQGRMQMVESIRHGQEDDKITSLMAERDRLHALISTSHEQHTQYVNDTKKKLCDLETQLEASQTEVRRVTSKLELANNELSALQAKHKNTLAELNELQSGNADPTGHRNKSDAEQLKSRLNYVELQLRTAQVELTRKDAELASARGEMAKYEKSVSSFEANFGEKQAAEQRERDLLRAQLDEWQTQSRNTKQELQTLQTQHDAIGKQVQQLIDEKNALQTLHIEEREKLEQEIITLKETVNRESTKYEDAVKEKAMLEARCTEIETARTGLSKSLSDAQRELASAKQQIEKITNEQANTRAELATAVQAVATTQASIHNRHVEHKEKEKALTDEIAELKNREKGFIEQIQSLGNQVSVLQRTGSSSQSDEASQSTDVQVDSSKSIGSLTQTLQFLREHKEVAETAREKAESEARILADRVQQLEQTSAERQELWEKSNNEVQRLKDLVSDREALQSRIQLLQEKEKNANELQEAHALLQTEHEEASKSLNELRAQLDAEQKLKSETEAKVVGLGAELARARNDLTTSVEKHNRLAAEKQETEEKINNECSRLKTELEKRQADVTKAEEEVVTLRGQVQTVNAQMLKLKTDHKTAEEELAKKDLLFQKCMSNEDKAYERESSGDQSNELQLRTLANHYKKRSLEAEQKLKAAGLDAVEADASAAPGSPAHLAAGGASVSADNTPTSQKLPQAAGVKTESADSAADVASLTQRLNELTQQHHQHETTIQDLNARNNKLQEEKTANERELDELRAASRQAQEAVLRAKTLEAQILRDQETVKRCEETIAMLGKQKEQLELKLQQAKEQVMQLQAQLATAQQQQQQQQRVTPMQQSSGIKLSLQQQPVAQVTAQVQQQPPPLSASSAMSQSSSSSVTSRRIRLNDSTKQSSSTPTPTAKVEPTTVKLQSRASNVVPPRTFSAVSSDQGSSSTSSASVTAAIAPMIVSTSVSASTINQPPHAVVNPQQLDTAQQDSMVSGSLDAVWGSQQQPTGLVSGMHQQQQQQQHQLQQQQQLQQLQQQQQQQQQQQLANQQQQQQQQSGSSNTDNAGNNAEAMPAQSHGVVRKRMPDTERVDQAVKRSRTSPFEQVSTSSSTSQPHQVHMASAHALQPHPNVMGLDDDDGVASSQDDDQFALGEHLQGQFQDEDEEDDEEPLMVDANQGDDDQQQVQLDNDELEIDVPQQQADDDIDIQAAVSRNSAQPDHDDQVPSDLYQLDNASSLFGHQQPGGGGVEPGDSEVPNQPTFGAVSSGFSGTSSSHAVVTQSGVFGGRGSTFGITSSSSSSAFGGFGSVAHGGATFGSLMGSGGGVPNLTEQHEQPPEVNLDSDSNEATSSTQAAVVPGQLHEHDDMPGMDDADRGQVELDDTGDFDEDDDENTGDASQPDESSIDDVMNDEDEALMREAAMKSMMERSRRAASQPADDSGVGSSGAPQQRQGARPTTRAQRLIKLNKIGSGYDSAPSSSGIGQSGSGLGGAAGGPGRFANRAGRRSAAGRKTIGGGGRGRARQVYYENK